MNVGDSSGESSAKLRGSMITLFGEPAYESEDYENAFTYIIEASDQHGGKWIFTVYEGPSGFAMGGKHQKAEMKEVAYAFSQKLLQVPPADFERNMIYNDFNIHFTYGCKSGECYTTE